MLAKMMSRQSRHQLVPTGFTLIELMVTIAIMAVIIALVAPSFRRMIEMQRLRSITAQLVTDLQFARSEAVQRNALMRLDFEQNGPFGAATLTCYTIYTAPSGAVRCDCRLGVGAACLAVAGSTEIRTVQVPSDSLGVQVSIDTRPLFGNQFDWAFAFDNVTGGLFVIPTDDSNAPFEGIRIDSFLDNQRALAVKISRAGRPSVCAPAGSTMTEIACPP